MEQAQPAQPSRPGPPGRPEPMQSVPATTADQLPDPLPEDLAVLDVREAREWVQGHIHGAVHIPLAEVPARVEEIPPGRTLVVCRVGGRSAQAAGYLLAAGHDVVHLEGGMLDWEAAGRPMVNEGAGPARVE